MRRPFFAIASLVLSLATTFALFAADKLQITPDRDSGVYKSGEKVTWKITLTGDAIPADAKVEYEVRPGGLKVGEPQSQLLTAGATEISASRDKPGNLLVVHYKTPGSDRPITAYGGAVFDPELIKPSMPAPDDFDAFWKSKIDELHAIPMNAKLEKVEIGNPKIEYYKFTLHNIKGKKIHGQLAKPAGGKNLPALLQVQWAGVYPLERGWITGHAQNGWLAVNIIAHDLPIDEKPEFYQAKARGELDDYPGIGNDDRETSYFLPMFLSCRRTVDFITEHADWNKKTLVVHGGSQGGYQSIVTAGLAPAVTAIAANVPAGCDHTGRAAGREPGWPNWASRTWKGRKEKKMLQASRYFDAMNFASRVKCPALIGVGLVDTACPVEGVLATCNELKGDKQIILMPLTDHSGDHKAYYTEFGLFIEKQKQREE
jgi:cephalosporin-C deacetylase